MFRPAKAALSPACSAFNSTRGRFIVSGASIRRRALAVYVSGMSDQVRLRGVVKLVQRAVIIHPPLGAHVVVVIDQEILVFIVVLEGFHVGPVTAGHLPNSFRELQNRLAGGATVFV